ncbi:MAG: GspE/PulE family protein [Planctomycetota bacterium]|jgi:type II secretory ATPase GspE/PulE/Tfp pilus assembly ATPase PilB-like protein
MGIGTILVERGLITESQLDEAILEQKRTGERLDHVLVRLGCVDADMVLEAIGRQFDMEIVDLSEIEVDDATLRTLPSRLVFKQLCVPIRRTATTLHIATCDPFELSAFDELRLLTGLGVELVLADERDLRKFIRSHYGVAGDTLDALANDDEDGADLLADPASGELDADEEASVIKLVNDLLLEAIRERATDIHIEPYEDELTIRYRIDGVLSEAGVPPTVNRFRNAIVSRLKIMSGLNIAEKRKPQDGRITLRHKGREFDLRVSIIPMVSGEGVVLRVLDNSVARMGLEDLGMPSAILERWDTVITRPHGILLVTGPTGSGKSTTLYASLNRIVSDAVKAITVEDPVEYQVDGVNQIQVNNATDMTFAAGLRAILRHDPDIIMIGEIRDLETAEAAVQASLTGHLVFSTLHTNDAAGATTRLLDMGIEPFLVASSVEGILAQRLIRRVCEQCGRRREITTAELPEGLEPPPDGMVMEALGCRECRRTGFRGRVGAFELLRMTDNVRDLVVKRADANTIRASAAAERELNLLRDAAWDLVRRGITTPAEAMRVIRV